MEEKKSLQQIILEARKAGEVIVMGIEGPMFKLLDDFVRQPVDGLLYDLNRLEEVTLTFIDDPKWVNDFAVALVIRKLKADIDKLEAENQRLRELCNDVALGHRNPYDSNYNECDKEPCAWCEEFEALGGG